MEKITILCATDDHYVPYCGIMLTSLYENNRDVEITTYMLTDGLSEYNLDRLSRLAELYKTKIEIITLANDTLPNCPVWPGDHISAAAYYRLFVAEILPEEITKVLYLDCDIVVARSLRDLWNTDIIDYAAGAVIDSGHFDKQRNERVGIIKAEHYFNSGVLLINMDYWRKNHVLDQFLRFINDNKENLRSHDQDVLNAVLKERVKYLSVIYNFQDFYLFPPYFNRYGEDFKQQILGTVSSDITIYHLSMPVKPLSCWHCVYPFHAIWKQFQKVSLWHSYYQTQSLKERLNCSILKICWKWGLKRLKMDFIKIR